MKAFLLSISCLILFLSCKKEKGEQLPDNTTKPDSTRDFMFIPMKDARWVSHYYGIYITINGGSDYYFDPSPKFLITIVPTGTDTFVGSRHYYKFHQTSNGSTSGGYPFFYLREDTLNKKVYYAKNQFGKFAEKEILDYNVEIGSNVDKTPVSFIDSFLLDNKYFKRWNTGTINYPRFLQAYGIGGHLGLYDGYSPSDGAKYRGTTFFYNNDSININ